MAAKLRHHGDAPLLVAVFRQIQVFHIGVFHQRPFTVHQHRVLGLLQGAGRILAAALGKDGLRQQALPEQLQALAVAQLLLYPLPGHTGGGDIEAERLVPNIFLRAGAGIEAGSRGGRCRGGRVHLGHLPGFQLLRAGAKQQAYQQRQNDLFHSHLKQTIFSWVQTYFYIIPHNHTPGKFKKKAAAAVSAA